MTALPTKKIPQLFGYPDAVLSGGELLEVALSGVSYRIAARMFVLPTDSLVTMSGMAGSLPGSRQLVSSTSVEVVDGGDGGQVELFTLATATLPDGLQTTALPIGQNNNLALAPNMGYLDLSTSGGNSQLSGIVAPLVDGLILIVTNTGPQNVQMQTQNINSDPANRFRLPANITLTPNGSITLRYSFALTRWVQLS